MDTTLEKETSSTAIYKRLREDILLGAIPPGEKLVIDNLSKSYKVSNIPLREALNRLLSERLVDRYEQRGFYAAPISIERWQEIVKARCWLESKALEESIANRDAAWEENIVLAFHRLSRRTWENLDGDQELRLEWEVLHRTFHQALIANNGSPWLTEFCETLATHAERYLAISASSALPHANNVADHRDLMEATLSGDAEVATRKLVEHYKRTLRKVALEMKARMQG